MFEDTEVSRSVERPSIHQRIRVQDRREGADEAAVRTVHRFPVHLARGVAALCASPARTPATVSVAGAGTVFVDGMAQLHALRQMPVSLPAAAADKTNPTENVACNTATTNLNTATATTAVAPVQGNGRARAEEGSRGITDVADV